MTYDKIEGDQNLVEMGGCPPNEPLQVLGELTVFHISFFLEGEDSASTPPPPE